MIERVNNLTEVIERVKNLTGAQQRYLVEIRTSPGRTYNGRARKPLEALRKAGLITYEYELVPHSGLPWTERLTCWPVQFEIKPVKYEVEVEGVGRWQVPWCPGTPE